MTNRELLDLARERLNCSYYEIAKRLDIQPNRIYQAKSGTHPLSDHLILQLAKLAKIDPAVALLSSVTERTKDKEKKKIWERVAKIVETNAAPVLTLSVTASLLYQALHPYQCILCKLRPITPRPAFL